MIFLWILGGLFGYLVVGGLLLRVMEAMFGREHVESDRVVSAIIWPLFIVLAVGGVFVAVGYLAFALTGLTHPRADLAAWRERRLSEREKAAAALLAAAERGDGPPMPPIAGPIR